jgi:hypothetical protein
MAASVFHTRASRFLQDAEKSRQRYWKVKAEGKVEQSRT